MRELSIWIVSLSILSLVVLLGVWLHSSPIGRLLWPPEDLYTPLVLKNLDVSRKGEIVEAEFNNQYEGTHDLGIYVSKRIESELKSQLRITVSGDKGVILERVLDRNEFQFWGWEKGKSGVALMVYEAPSELPLNVPLRIRAEVVVPDKEFIKKYGPTMFFVRKMSDK